MFGNVPRPVWEKWLAPDPLGRIELACRAMLIECDGLKILCETGIGAFFDPKMADRYGVEDPEHRLLESLSKLGIKEEQIDVLILSHLHFDHAGGLLPTWNEIQATGQRLLFPNAKYVVGKEAFDRAKKPHSRDKASFIPGMVELLEASGRLVVIEGSKLPGVLEDRLSFRFSHGHTPGQMHTIFKGDSKTVIFAGDLIPGTSWVHLPVTMGYDRFPEMLIDEKTALYAVAVEKEWLCFYTHDTSTAMSQIQNINGRFTPTEKVSEPVRMAF